MKKILSCLFLLMSVHLVAASSALALSPLADDTAPNVFMIGLENALFRIRTAFTFQAERKAELMQSRLNQLDATLDHCQQTENEKCIERIERVIQKTQQHTERFLEQKTQLLEKHSQRYQAWQHARSERLKNRLQPEQRQKNQEQLIELRSEPLKNRLDQTTDKVDQRQEQLDKDISL